MLFLASYFACTVKTEVFSGVGILQQAVMAGSCLGLGLSMALRPGLIGKGQGLALEEPTTAFLYFFAQFASVPISYMQGKCVIEINLYL